ncbi:hypothetical protein EGW08_000078 [Elysia chlorotica]|uniref:Major facilitator superfamily (MFS) profile domain-containing protein n=1 Tax=Elysia chlorotica TaxID=188477 RepID=A0A3S1BYT0_ELYCH|nr:hypothetical protein EGW08_000078 [Elysia chlorotica]
MMEEPEQELPAGAEKSRDESQQVDSILRSINAKGRYQVLHVIVLLLSTPAAGLQLFSNVFTAKAVPHVCAGPPEGSNWTDVFGHSELSNLTVVREECELILKDNSSVLDTAACIYGNDYELSRDASVVSQFDLVCDMDWLARLSQTFVILGQGIGAAFTSFLSDRFGRKTVIVSSNFGLLVCGVAVAYAPNAGVFVVLKFMIGAFQQGVVSVTTPYFLELFPMENRDLQSWLVGSTWGFSVMFLSPVAYVFRHSSWRTLQTALSLYSVVAVIQWWYMDESLRWLLANRKYKDAEKVIRRMARVNKRNEDAIVENLVKKDIIPIGGGEKVIKPSKKEVEVGATKQLSLLDILKIRRLLINTLCLWFAWFTAALSFFTIYLTATSLSGDPYLNFGLTAIMELPSNIFFWFYLNRLGRKRCLQIMFSVVGTGVVLAGIFKKLEESNSTFAICTLLASLWAMAGASGCFGMVFSFTPELFPTNLRGQAVGVSSLISRVGGMLGPFAGLLAKQAVWAPGFVIGLCAAIVCFLSLFLPETSERVLPQTVHELQAWFKNKNPVSNGERKGEIRGSDGIVHTNLAFSE